MYQIQIGDAYVGYFTLDGDGVAAPIVSSVCYFSESLDPVVNEHIDIQFKGTYSQISSVIEKLELIAQRAVMYESAAYRRPQFLRFEVVSGEVYFTKIWNIYLDSNPAGYKQAHTGSRVVTLHYTRNNYFDGALTQLSLNGRAGKLTTYPFVNHTDGGAYDDSTMLVDKADFSTHLPAPLRLTFQFKKSGSQWKDLFWGVFHHPSYDGFTPFFGYYNTLTGGTQTANSYAIQGYYRTVTWSSASWYSFTTFNVSSANVAYFDGRSFRPILHLYATHAYNDLYFKVAIQRGSNVLYLSDLAHSPPAYGYIVLPPIEIPPNYLLREVDPEGVSVVLYAMRSSGASTTIQFDCLTLFPLSYAASFYGYYNLDYEDVLYDDSHRERYDIRTAANNAESVAHARVGGPLCLFPNAHNRIFLYVTSQNNLMPPDYIGNVTASYRKRVRIL